MDDCRHERQLTDWCRRQTTSCGHSWQKSVEALERCASVCVFRIVEANATMFVICTVCVYCVCVFEVCVTACVCLSS